jgi:hypothetical protein
MKIFVIALVGFLIASSVFAQDNDSKIIEYLKSSLAYALDNKDNMIDNWKKQYTDIKGKEAVVELLGYRPSDFLVSIANISSYLYKKTSEKKYAEITKNIIVSSESYRKFFPEEFRKRVEYKEGIPVVNWFRTLPIYIECYQHTKDSGIYSKSDLEKIEESVASSVDIIFAFPEWGAMNRAMLRAGSCMAAAVAFPNHPPAKKLSETHSGG